MTNETNSDEIDYDKLIEYELSHLDDGDYVEEVEDNNVLESNINDSDPVDVVLEKIFKTHEDFYKKCFDNAVDDCLDIDEDDDIVNKYRNTDKVDEKTKQILSYYNLTYDQFVETISSIKDDFENDPDVNESNIEKVDQKTGVDIPEMPLKALIDHDKIMHEINEKKWNEYDKFYREFDERCKSARSISQKELQQEASLIKCQRQKQQANLNSQLAILQENLNADEIENKARIMEIELEIQQEKEILINLQKENKEIINNKLNRAAITIQKHFRKYRVRKRIGSQIDEARNNARRKLFNTKLIINEKKAQKQKAAELRKWRQEQEKEKVKINDDEISKVQGYSLKTETQLKICDIAFSDSSKKKKSGKCDSKDQNTSKIKINKKLSKFNIIDSRNLNKSISDRLEMSRDTEKEAEKIKILNDDDGAQSGNSRGFQEYPVETYDSNNENKNINNIMYLQNNNNNSHSFEYKLKADSVNLSNINISKIVENDIEINNSVSSTIPYGVHSGSFNGNISIVSSFSSEFNDQANKVNVHNVNEHENTTRIFDKIIITNHHAILRTNIEMEPQGEIKFMESSDSSDLTNISNHDIAMATFYESAGNPKIKPSEGIISDKINFPFKEIDQNTGNECKGYSNNDNSPGNRDLFLNFSEELKQRDFMNKLNDFPKIQEKTNIQLNDETRKSTENRNIIEGTNENAEIPNYDENRISNENRDIIEGTNGNSEIPNNNENKMSNENRDIIEEFNENAEIPNYNENRILNEHLDIIGTSEKVEILNNNENRISNENRDIIKESNENVEIPKYNENRISNENRDIIEGTNGNSEIPNNNENKMSNQNQNIIKQINENEEMQINNEESFESCSIIKETPIFLKEIPKTYRPVCGIQNLNVNENSVNFAMNEEKIRDIFKSNLKLTLICLEWMHHIIDQKNSGDSKSNNDIESELSIPVIPKHFCKNSNSDLNLEHFSPNSITMAPNTCKSLSIIKSEMDSIRKLKDSFPVLERLVLNETSTNYFHMDDLPESIRYININQNQIEWAYFGQNIESNLTILSCSSNELTDLPLNAFRNCHNVVNINFSNNNFVNIDSIFRGNIPLKKLCCLNLNNNILSSLDNLDTYCPYLTHLSVSGNHIKNWSYRNKFPYLVDLDISHNSLTMLQAWLNTPLLVSLNLSYNLLADIQSFQYSWMPCLSVLILDCNKLTSIPELCFLSMHKISIQRNLLSESINCEDVFLHCPLVSSINLKDNPAPQNIPKRYVKNQGNDDEIICPEGEFANGCYDFSDSVQQKSDRFNNLLKSSNDLDLTYKHQIHYYRFIREMVEDHSVWFEEILFDEKSHNKKYEKIHYDSAIKIQSLWRGYKTRKWYKSILSYARFDMEESFDELGLVDVLEYDKSDVLNNWNDFQEIPTITEAWKKSSENLKDDNSLMKFKMPADTNTEEIVISGKDSTHRSNSTSMLSRKELEIMKEWGFEDPNSALWMLERAKKFQKKTTKGSKRQILSLIQKPTLQTVKTGNSMKIEQNLQKVSLHVAPVNTVTIHPPESVHNSNLKSKIDQWLSDSDFIPNVPSAINSDKRSFLPAIELDNQFKKGSSNCSRPKSSTTKLPAINYAPGNA